MRLCDRVSDKCYVIGNYIYFRFGLLLEEEFIEEFKISGIVFKLDQINIIIDIFEFVKKMEGGCFIKIL